jgi:hypothetical protein
MIEMVGYMAMTRDGYLTFQVSKASLWQAPRGSRIAELDDDGLLRASFP